MLPGCFFESIARLHSNKSMNTDPLPNSELKKLSNRYDYKLNVYVFI